MWLYVGFLWSQGAVEMCVSDGGGRAGCNVGRRDASEVWRNAPRRVTWTFFIGWIGKPKFKPEFVLSRPWNCRLAYLGSILHYGITCHMIWKSATFLSASRLANVPPAYGCLHCICSPSPTWSVPTIGHKRPQSDLVMWSWQCTNLRWLRLL